VARARAQGVGNFFVWAKCRVHQKDVAVAGSRGRDPGRGMGSGA